MKFHFVPEGVKEIPEVCSHLEDQSHCAEVLQYCSAGLDPDLCTVKLVFLHVTHGGKWTFPIDYAKSIYHGSVKVLDVTVDVLDWIFSS